MIWTRDTFCTLHFLQIKPVCTCMLLAGTPSGIPHHSSARCSCLELFRLFFSRLVIFQAHNFSTSTKPPKPTPTSPTCCPPVPSSAGLFRTLASGAMTESLSTTERASLAPLARGGCFAHSATNECTFWRGGYHGGRRSDIKRTKNDRSFRGGVSTGARFV